MLLLALFLVSPVSVCAHITKYSPQVGVWGDDASIGNSGVQVGILTHRYAIDSGTFDYFWVGDNLADGSFIQFGYGMEPGRFCLRWINESCTGITDNISNSDARWQWQYWPNASLDKFDVVIGRTNSAGENDTWHTYAIMPNAAGWAFVLDGVEVDNITVHALKSKDRAYAVAERNTDSSSFGTLGPVEFKNLEYLDNGGWHTVDSLLILRSHSILSGNLVNPYGLELKGPNDVVAGSSLPLLGDDQLLWTSGDVTLVVSAGQNAKAFVTVLSNTTMFTNTSSVGVPQGMFASVQLQDAKIASPGFFGMVGGVDVFAGWTGNVNTSNTSVRILMDGNKSIQANWEIYLPSLLIFVVIVLIVIGLLGVLGYFLSRWKQL